MSAWTHALCRACYAAVEPGREPHRVENAPAEPCCRCGARTGEPIYYRADPKDFGCRGTGGTHDEG
jgi:hypothetical protein